MPRHLLALALGVCAGVAVMVVAAHGIALSRTANARHLLQATLPGFTNHR